VSDILSGPIIFANKHNKVLQFLLVLEKPLHNGKELYVTEKVLSGNGKKAYVHK
jgi:hypothetical protein